MLCTSPLASIVNHSKDFLILARTTHAVLAALHVTPPRMLSTGPTCTHRAEIYTTGNCTESAAVVVCAAQPTQATVKYRQVGTVLAISANSVIATRFTAPESVLATNFERATKALIHTAT